MPLNAGTSRRALLRRGGATIGAATGAATVLSSGRAEAGYRPRHYRGDPLLSASGRHLVGRFSYGLTPALTRRVKRNGGPAKWFEAQLEPHTISDHATDALKDWWPNLSYSPQELWKRQVSGVEGGWEAMTAYQRWLLVRRIRTRRPLHEMMTEFWMNHLHVPVHDDAVFTYRVDYDRVIREHALGRFDEMLQEAIPHPAMGMFLDNAVSTKWHPNENLGREVLELHTVGRGNYSEDDVKSSARILTGYRVDMWRSWNAAYSPDDHYTGSVRVKDFSHDNLDADGRACVQAYLAYLAHHPQTAQRIARKLAVKFVSDNPSQGLVDHLADVYLRHDTAVAPMLRALVASREFATSAGAKVRTPTEDVVATYRVLGVKLQRPPSGDNGFAATAILWQTDSLGATPHDWPRPDGPPLDNESWSSPGRLLASMDVHWVMSGTWWPSEGIVYHSPKSWLPKKAMRFDELVDHVSQRLLGRRSTSALLEAACQFTKLKPGEVITVEHPLIRWNFHRLLTTVLDSPAHLTR